LCGAAAAVTVIYMYKSIEKQKISKGEEIIMEDKEEEKSPEDFLTYYIDAVNKGEYEKMYEMLAEQSRREISREDFISRNQKIYEGIEMKNMTVKVNQTEEQENALTLIWYHTGFETAAGPMSFENKARIVKEDNRYRLLWTDACIFPELWGSDKVRIVKPAAARGCILDRNGKVLAGQGEASQVGIVPGKLEDPQKAVKDIAELLGMNEEEIQKQLDAKWVKEDSFVPLKTMPLVNEALLMVSPKEQKLIETKCLQDKLLKIKGVRIIKTTVRQYPLGEAASHLLGYVQSVTADDLEEHKGEGYTSGSKIGKVGLEALYEKELRGTSGCEIYLENEKGEKKQVLASKPKRDGENIKLTIDAGIQTALYQEFQKDKSCSVAMNPETGEILALVSTPSYDDNSFIFGMSSEKWNELNENEDKPMLNRYRQRWTPGSTFKPVIASIGLSTGAIDPTEDFGYEGLRWRKDASWGGYYITTLHDYKPVILKNALVYSDNIYFAKAALKIGEENLTNMLQRFGFNETLPFEISVKKSQYSNEEHITSEIQLADSGYGQGQILVNPIHLASIYTMFSNEGNIIQPYLRYEEEPRCEVWVEHAVPKEIARQVADSCKDVVNSEHGTAYAAHREDIELRGKTGTAEIKASQTDQSGTELGWFAVYTADPSIETPLQIVTMVEDVKDRGGSVYVVKKVKEVLDDTIYK